MSQTQKNIILNGADCAVANFDVSDGLVTIGTLTFPWKDLLGMKKSVAVSAVAGVVTVTPGALAAETDYYFFVTQAGYGTERIGFYSGASAPATANVVVDGWKAALDAHVNAGRLDISQPAGATLVMTSVAASPLLTAEGAVACAAVQTTTGVAGHGLGADLLAAGIVDVFDGALPVSGTDYSLYEVQAMLSSGNGGFAESGKQKNSIPLYLDEGAAGYAALIVEIDNVIAGLDPDGTGSEELVGADTL